jgi:hypothetical protein
MATAPAVLRAQGANSAQKIVVTGCVERAQRNGSVAGTPVGTTAVSPNTADDEANSQEPVNRFLLTGAVVSGARPETNPAKAGSHTENGGRAEAGSHTENGGRAGAGSHTENGGRAETGSRTQAASAPGTEMKSFALQGHEAELQAHTGHRVELTGSVAPPRRPSTAQGQASAASGVQRLVVESVKMIKNSCAG